MGPHPRRVAPGKEGIGRERMPVEQRLSLVVAEKGPEDIIRGGGDSERHGPTGQAFAETDDIGGMPQVFPRKQFTRSSEPRQHFIGDGNDPVLLYLVQQLIE